MISKLLQMKTDLNKFLRNRKIRYQNGLRCLTTRAVNLLNMNTDSLTPVVNKDQNRSIRAKDYKKLEPPEPKTACYACGKKGSCVY